MSQNLRYVQSQAKLKILIDQGSVWINNVPVRSLLRVRRHQPNFIELGYNNSPYLVSQNVVDGWRTLVSWRESRAFNPIVAIRIPEADFQRLRSAAMEAFEIDIQPQVECPEIWRQHYAS